MIEINKDKLSKSDDVILSWQAKEFTEYNKGFYWYLGLTGVFLVLVAYAVWIRAWTMVIMLLVAEAVVIQYSLTKPKDTEVVITKKGVSVNSFLHGYDDLKSFWIGTNKIGESTLYLVRKAKYAPSIAVRMSDQKPDIVKEALLKYLVLEPNEDEDMVDKISRIIKF